jgi:hypothetical protein
MKSKAALLKLLHGIKHNPNMSALQLNVRKSGLKHNIHTLCRQTLDGNIHLSSLTVIVCEHGIIDSFESVDVLSSELASCKNGWNLKYICLQADNEEMWSNAIFDHYVAPLLSLNWFCHCRNTVMKPHDALVTTCISAINQGAVMKEITNCDVDEQVPSKASVIYLLLQNAI